MRTFTKKFNDRKSTSPRRKKIKGKKVVLLNGCHCCCMLDHREKLKRRAEKRDAL